MCLMLIVITERFEKPKDDRTDTSYKAATVSLIY